MSTPTNALAYVAKPATTDEAVALITSFAQEIVQLDELKELIASGKNLIAYDGLEPSGQLHLAQGIIRAININKMVAAGFTFKILLADWHAQANNKFGGNLEMIQTAGKYMIEVWKALGLSDKVEFVWASEMVKNTDYWQLVLQIARTNQIKRFVRTAEMMGREESMDLTLAQLMYAAMQIADIFTMDCRVAQLGMDQRKVNMLAREIGPQLGYWKPISVSHGMLAGLNKPADKDVDSVSRTIHNKMSKSIPDSAIFMTDSAEDVERKINKAWCPEGEIEGNPVMSYAREISFEVFGKLEISRPEKWGGNITFTNFAELEKEFSAKNIHPSDLKAAVAKDINTVIEPVRQHFATNPDAKALLEKLKTYQVSR